MTGNAPTKKPLSTYHEGRLEGNRHFELFDDSIVVRGENYITNEFETRVSLLTLNPHFGWIKTRSAGFWLTVVVATGTMLLLSMPVMFLLRDTDYLLLGAVLAAVATLLLTLGVFVPKIEFANFQNNQGIRILNIGRAGPDKARYEEFVKLVAEQIVRVRQGPIQSVESDAERHNC